MFSENTLCFQMANYAGILSAMRFQRFQSKILLLMLLVFASILGATNFGVKIGQLNAHAPKRILAALRMHSVLMSTPQPSCDLELQSRAAEGEENLPNARMPTKRLESGNPMNNFLGRCKRECDLALGVSTRIFRNGSFTLWGDWIPGRVDPGIMCVAFMPQRGFCFDTAKPEDPYGHIRDAENGVGFSGAAIRFFSRLHRVLPENVGGALLISLSDGANGFSDEARQELWERKVPLLAHVFKRTTKKDFIFFPDYQFIKTNGFLAQRRLFGMHARPIVEKAPKVLWRGAPTGRSARSCVGDSSCCFSVPRVVAVLKARNISHLDFGLSRVYRSCITQEQRLREGGLMGSYIKEYEWPQLARGLLDIDGNSNAWGLFWRLASRSVVFRVESDLTNYYMSLMKPWVHYIPVYGNLSNLEAVTKIVTSEDKGDLSFLQSIVENAQKLTDDITMESETRRVACELVRVWS